MPVIVLGCGPAGLLAAHGVAQLGIEPVIISNKQRSRIGGAQFLHVEIPGLTGHHPDGLVNFIRLGSPVGYAIKVYGSTTRPTSWRDYQPGWHPVWNMQEAYDKLWEMYQGLIRDAIVTPDMLGGMLAAGDITVLSTIPPRSYCVNRNHNFVEQEVYISTQKMCGEMEIVYNGQWTAPWYRASQLWGHSFAEYAPKCRSHAGEGAVRVSKPLFTNCDCFSQLRRLGRYGRYKKGVLIHHAYEGVKDALLAMQ